MHFIGTCFQKLEGWLPTFGIEVFGGILKPTWIDEALFSTGRQSRRQRKLTASFSVWLVIAMSFYRNLSITNILRRMGSVLGVGSLWDQGRVPTSSSGVEARDRIGVSPLRWLVEKLREWIWATHRTAMIWRGWLLVALDGTTFKVPDSVQNRRRFGLPGSKRGRTAFPQMRALFLVSAHLHFILEALFAPFGRAEIEMGYRMLRALPSGALVLLDRGLSAWQLLLGVRDRGSHFLARATTRKRGRRLAVLGRGDYLVEMKLPRELRSKIPHLPRRVIVRELTARIGGKWFRFLTSLLDSDAYPAAELVELYARRWEEEIAFDEIKTHQAGLTTVNRPVLFRCQTTRRVMQEAYGLVLAYNLVRALMTEAARKQNIPPLRISFIDSLERIRQAALLMAAAPTSVLPAIYSDLIESLALLRLPPRRKRKNPREACIKMSCYLKKWKHA